MYIAGLDLGISSTQTLETLVVFSVVDFFRYLRTTFKTLAVYAESKGGRVKPERMPARAQVVNTIQAIVIHVPPLIYAGAVLLNKFRQPEWMVPYTLPDDIAGIRLDPVMKGVLRLGACAAGLALRCAFDCALRHLGEQWHFIGRREHPRVVHTGPYAWVRHPLYTVTLVQVALWSVMFWSYIPLIALGTTIAVFAVKIPMEEDLIEQDEGIRQEYRDYKKKVPARIIPHIW
ncbi:hypothetical protein JVU11DRAFT_9972 [Chiua virens]|nr:hypothetical protein JVU11DRAFT_9972 [Chiua virens]